MTTFSVKVGGHGIIFTQSLNFSKEHQQSYVYARGRYDIWPWASSENYAINRTLFCIAVCLGSEVRRSKGSYDKRKVFMATRKT